MRNAVEMIYDEIRSDLDSLDLVLWKSGDKLAKLIQWGTASEYTHVGMIVRFPGDIVMLWESTFDNVSSGVRLIPLSKALQDEDVYIRRATVSNREGIFDRLMAVRKELDGRPFENNVLEFICAAYDGPGGDNKRNITSLFCSELIAETLIQIGLMDGRTPSNEYTPRDFGDDGSLPLIGLKYEKSICVKRNITALSAKTFNKAKVLLSQS